MSDKKKDAADIEEKSARNNHGGDTRRGGPALEAAYQLVLWLTPAVEKFPRSYKFTLGDRTMATAVEALDHLIAATYSRDPTALLSQQKDVWNIKLASTRCRKQDKV